MVIFIRYKLKVFVLISKLFFTQKILNYRYIHVQSLGKTSKQKNFLCDVLLQISLKLNSEPSWAFGLKMKLAIFMIGLFIAIAAAVSDIVNLVAIF